MNRLTFAIIALTAIKLTAAGFFLWDDTLKHVTITSILEEPFLMLRENHSETKLEGNDQFIGYCKDLADLVAHTLRINYTINLVNDSRYGGIDPNSSSGWNGMVHELIIGQADVAIAALTITSARSGAIDFTSPFMNAGLGAIIKKHESGLSGFAIIFAPLTIGVWLSVIAFYLLFAAILYLISNYSTLEELTTFDCFWYPLQHLTLQRLETAPKCKSTRMLMSIWWLFIVIILANYIISLHKYFTDVIQYPTETDDFLHYSDIEYGVLRHSSSYDFFRRSKIASHAKMWDYMNANPHVFTDTVAEGIARVRESNGKYAFFASSALIDYINDHQPCDTTKVGHNFNEIGFGIATQAKSKLLHKFNLAVLSLKENGDLTKLQYKWWYDRSECTKFPSEDENIKSLTLSKLSGLYMLLLIGLIVNAFVYGIELFVSKKNERVSVEEQNNVHKRLGDEIIPLT